jgi:hypothetical protein
MISMNLLPLVDSGKYQERTVGFATTRTVSAPPEPRWPRLAHVVQADTDATVQRLRRAWPQRSNGCSGEAAHSLCR